MDTIWLLLRRMGLFFILLGMVILVVGAILMILSGERIPEGYVDTGTAFVESGIGVAVIGSVLLASSYLSTPSRGNLSHLLGSSDRSEKRP